MQKPFSLSQQLLFFLFFHATVAQAPSFLLFSCASAARDSAPLLAPPLLASLYLSVLFFLDLGLFQGWLGLIGNRLRACWNHIKMLKRMFNFLEWFSFRCSFWFGNGNLKFCGVVFYSCVICIAHLSLIFVYAY